MGWGNVSISEIGNGAVVGPYVPLCLFLQCKNKTLCPGLEWKVHGMVAKPALQTVALVFDQPFPPSLEWETPFLFPPSTRSPTLVRFPLDESGWRQRLTISRNVAQTASWWHLHTWSHWTLSWPWPMPAIPGCWRPSGQPGRGLSSSASSIHGFMQRCHWAPKCHRCCRVQDKVFQGRVTAWEMAEPWPPPISRLFFAARCGLRSRRKKKKGWKFIPSVRTHPWGN